MRTWHDDPAQVKHVYSRMQSGWIGAACLGGDGSPQAVLSGAFNPLHAGHRAMAETAARRLRVPVSFELSLLNVDKAALTADALWDRCRHFDKGDQLWVTKARTFAEKARIFPKAWFVVGIDTLERIVDPGYYHGSTELRDRALQRVIKRQCQFLVFGRLQEGRFRTLADIPLPESFAEYCSGVPENDFRVDISSTQLRDA